MGHEAIGVVETVGADAPTTKAAYRTKYHR